MVAFWAVGTVFTYISFPIAIAAGIIDGVLQGGFLPKKQPFNHPHKNNQA
jgi:hypothetical protein